MQHWTKIALNTVMVVKIKIPLDVTSLSYMILTVEFQLQFIIIIIIIINRYWFLRCLYEHVHEHKTYVQPMVLHLHWPPLQPDAHPYQQLGKTVLPLAQSWASSRIRRAPKPCVRASIGGTVPSSDAFQCAACRWARLTFSVNASVVGGRLHNFKAAPIWVFFSPHFNPGFTHASTSAETFAIASQYEWRSLLEYNIASSACVSPIACCGSLAVLATLSALIFPMPNGAADVSAPVRAWMASRSGTIDVCTFTLCMMSITARSFTVEHMQSWPFVSATKWRSRAKTTVSSQITDTTSPTMHLVIVCHSI